MHDTTIHGIHNDDANFVHRLWSGFVFYLRIWIIENEFVIHVRFGACMQPAPPTCILAHTMRVPESRHVCFTRPKFMYVQRETNSPYLKSMILIYVNLAAGIWTEIFDNAIFHSFCVYCMAHECDWVCVCVLPAIVLVIELEICGVRKNVITFLCGAYNANPVVQSCLCMHFYWMYIKK